MKERMLISIILVGTFIIVFLLTTIITDTVARMNGFYSEGQQEEIGLYE